MKDYTSNSPVFSETIKILETSDPGHAEIINEPIKQLLQNTLDLKSSISALNVDLDNHVLYQDFFSGSYSVPSGLSIADFPLPTIDGYTPISVSSTAYWFVGVLSNLIIMGNKIIIQSYNSANESLNISVHGRIVYLKN